MFLRKVENRTDFTDQKEFYVAELFLICFYQSILLVILLFGICKIFVKTSFYEYAILR